MLVTEHYPQRLVLLVNDIIILIKQLITTFITKAFMVHRGKIMIWSVLNNYSIFEYNELGVALPLSRKKDLTGQ